MLSRIIIYPCSVCRCLLALCFLMSLSVIFFCSSLSAQPSETLEPKKPLEPEWEKWIDQRPVSGGLRVGVMMGVSESGIDPDVFTVILPASDLSLLCVEVSSQDGRYEAKIPYEVGKLSPGPIQLSLPTKYEKKLSGYKAKEVSILARLSQQCGAPVGTFVVAGWDERAPTDTTISVFINSRVPTYIVGGIGGTIEYEVRCSDLREGAMATVAYNKHCEVPESWVTPNIELYVRQRIRRGPTTSFRDVPLPIKLR